jgi:hypothetical protein
LAAVAGWPDELPRTCIGICMVSAGTFVWSTALNAPKLTMRDTVAVLLVLFWLSVASYEKESLPL